MQSRYTNYRFIGQQEDEVILRIIHRHWFNILVHFLGILFVLFLLVLGGFFMAWFSLDVSVILHPALATFLFNTLLLFIWLFGFFIWIDVWFDAWIITDRRVVNIEQRGLFVREASELNVTKIQDVTSEVVGIIPSILNYGNVFIQTAGEQERFVFRQVPDPVGVKEMITNIIHAQEDHESIAEAIEEDGFEEPR